MIKSTAVKFKETEVGIIPDEWDVFSIQQVSDVVGGGTPSTSDPDNFGGNIPWITPRDLSGHQSRYIARGERNITQKGLNSSSAKKIPAETILLTTRAPVGYLAIAKNEVTTNQGFHSMIPNEKTDTHFLFYLLKNNIQKLVDHASGTTFQELSGGSLKSLTFAFPKVDYQKNIAEILTSLDDKIELNRSINDNLEKMADALFKKLFININNELPEGWRVGKISDVVRVESGFPFSSTMFDDTGYYKLVTIKNVQDGYFVPECTDTLSAVPPKMPPHCYLKDGDILLSLTGNIGRVCIVTGENYLLNQRVAVLNPRDKNNRAFVYLLFKQKDFQNTLASMSHGTAQQNLSPIETRNLEINIPPENVLNEFAQIANTIFEILVQNTKQIHSLSSVRDYLLPRLMNGKITL